jgi:hypothetical protein
MAFGTIQGGYAKTNGRFIQNERINGQKQTDVLLQTNGRINPDIRTFDSIETHVSSIHPASSYHKGIRE